MCEKVPTLGLPGNVLFVVWEDVVLEDPAIGMVLCEVSVDLLDDSSL